MDNTPNKSRVFDTLSQESRLIRTARMLPENKRLTANQRKDIAERVIRFVHENEGVSRKSIALELGVSGQTISGCLNQPNTCKHADKQFIALHNWLELAARRENMVRRRHFVETSVAAEIIQVAGIVAETCKMGVVFGPAQIGKSFTLEAIRGDQCFGDPILIRINESLLRPLPVCRRIAASFDLNTDKTFDLLFSSVVERLTGTKRMLMFDEIERVHYKTLEMIRDLHDQTGCPVLLCGKPTIYAKLGFRDAGDFSEVTDQLASRIIMRRDLTQRTRGESPRPLFSREDIRRLIVGCKLDLKVQADAEKWLQSRASALGVGGIGRAMVCLYLAYKVAFVQGDETITVDHLDSVDELGMGQEDAEHIAEVIANSEGMRRVV